MSLVLVVSKKRQGMKDSQFCVRVVVQTYNKLLFEVVVSQSTEGNVQTESSTFGRHIFFAMTSIDCSRVARKPINSTIAKYSLDMYAQNLIIRNQCVGF